MLSAVLGIGWAITSPPQDGVVNNSHILHFFIGTAWLSLAFAARAAITAFAERRAVNTVVRGIGRRSLTIYLWHSAAAITTWHLLVEFAPLPRGVHSLGIAAGTIVITAAAVTIFGRLEDRAAGRVAAPRRAPAPVCVDAGPPHQPLRWLSTVAGIAVLGACAAYTLPPAWDEGHGDRPDASPNAFAFGAPEDAPTQADARPQAPRVPSQAPRRPTFERTTGGAPPVDHQPRADHAARASTGGWRGRRDDRGPGVVDAGEQPGRRRAWPRRSTPQSIDGRRRGASTGSASRSRGPASSRGRPQSASTGTAATSTRPQAFDIESITKTFTAALDLADGRTR